MVSSGKLVAKLWRRALAMLEGAKWRMSRGEYDLACFEAEQAAQLAIKSFLYEVLGSAPRIHDLHELLGLLYRVLEEGGLGELAGLVADFAKKRRKDIWLLNDAYYRGRYGYIDYSGEEAEKCIEAAKEVIEFIEKARRGLEKED